jgi:LacI family repressor for deo operon, udp, cdd, tsx, nupC, and nupG
LTTIHQPKYEIGTQSMKMLLDMVEGRENARKQVVLQHELVTRESTSWVNEEGYDHEED